MRVSLAAFVILLPLPGWAGVSTPDSNTALQPIPGAVYQSQEACTQVSGNSVVVVNGATFCKGPASAISHNSSRSNFSRKTKPKKNNNGAGN